MKNLAVFLFFLTTSICWLPLKADEKPLRFLPLEQPASDLINPNSFISYHRDKTGGLEITEAPGLDYHELPDSGISFGYTTDKFWLRLPVMNTTPNRQQWVLRTSAKFMRPLEIYSQSDNQPIEQLLYNDEFSSFGSRPENIRHLGVYFDLPANSKKVFYIRLGASGQAALTLSIGTPRAIAREQAVVEIVSAVFIAVLFTLALFNLFHFFAIQNRAYLYYGIQAVSFCLYITHMEGLTFQYL